MLKGIGEDGTVIGVPYAYHGRVPLPPLPQKYQPLPREEQLYYGVENPHQAGLVPSNAIYGDPKGTPLVQTMYRDSPAPFICIYCGSSGLTSVRSKPSLAAVVGCMIPSMLGICFLLPSMDCLWHKYHYCPSCKQEVAMFEKSDPCLVVDAPHWREPSFAVPA